MTKNTKIKDNDFVFKILIILLVLLIIIGIISWIKNNNKYNPNDKRIEKIYNYFNIDNLQDCDGMFNYSNIKITFDNVSEQTKMCVAYHKTKELNAEVEKIKKAKKEDVCKLDNYKFGLEDEKNECEVQKVKKETLASTYKEIFGKDIQKTDSFKIDNLRICYLKDEYYYCGLNEISTYILGNDASIYRLIDKVEEKSSEILIYDYFLKISGSKCFDNYTTLSENKICSKEYEKLKNKNINYKFIKKYGNKYKHTYKKSSNDSYYWVSSELIK